MICAKPAGFQYAAEPSSANEINVPPKPSALAPEASLRKDAPRLSEAIDSSGHKKTRQMTHA